jgi:hypothetical protein
MSLVQLRVEVDILIRDIKKIFKCLNTNKNVNLRHDFASSHTTINMKPTYLPNFT